MKPGASERHKAGREPRARSSRRGNQAVEGGHSRAIAGLHGPPEGVIVGLGRRNAGGQQSGGRLVLEEARHEVERLVDQPQAIAPHRCDGVSHGEGRLAGFWWMT